ncbi:hypothetical protein ABFV80_001866 [Vandammella animalimorsus]|uniref:InlB B-repeat-containing protein n=1 Tax=Vandammella animalimorsus TaxID=2029117 RepID=UPI00325AB5CF
MTPILRNTLAGAALALLGLAAAQAAIPAAERQALLDVYTHTQGDGWHRRTGWKQGADFAAPGTECDWEGVLCDAAQAHVVGLRLPENRLDGQLPEGLSNLRHMRRLELSGNQLAGPLPDLVAWPQLEHLDVSRNRLDGPIPALQGLSALQRFDVTSNRFSGALPRFDGLPALRQFGAADNRLSGELPALTGAPALQHFSVAGNWLTGAVPSLAGMERLQAFVANHNLLDGQLPLLDALPALVELNLSHNRLAGRLRLGHLPQLQDFNASFNQFSGPLPALQGLPRLKRLSLNNNQFSGAMPELGGLTALLWLRVEHNLLTGGPPAELPPGLMPGAWSALCPNRLQPASPTDTQWNAFTGGDWAAGCASISWAVRASAGPGGQVSPALQQGIAGAEAAIVIKPDPGQMLDAIDSSCGTASWAGAEMFFTGPLSADCRVQARFRPWAPGPHHAVRAVATDAHGGQILPSVQSVAAGGRAVFTLLPADGYEVESVTSDCDGAHVGERAFATGPVTAPCTVNAAFRPQHVPLPGATGLPGVPVLGPLGLMLLGGLLALVSALGLRRR